MCERWDRYFKLELLPFTKIFFGNFVQSSADMDNGHKKCERKRTYYFMEKKKLTKTDAKQMLRRKSTLRLKKAFWTNVLPWKVTYITLTLQNIFFAKNTGRNGCWPNVLIIFYAIKCIRKTCFPLRGYLAIAPRKEVKWAAMRKFQFRSKLNLFLCDMTITYPVSKLLYHI